VPLRALAARTEEAITFELHVCDLRVDGRGEAQWHALAHLCKCRTVGWVKCRMVSVGSPV